MEEKKLSAREAALVALARREAEARKGTASAARVRRSPRRDKARRRRSPSQARLSA